MEPTKFWIKTKKEKDLFAWFVTPGISAKAVVVLVHGFGEHSWRYLQWAERFVNAGFAFLSWDHQGHGLSDGQRGHIGSYRYFMEEIDLALAKAEEFFPNTPQILYGHSMGGNLAISYAQSQRRPIELLIATSPWISLAKRPSAIGRLLLEALRFTLPVLPIRAPVKASDISHVAEEVEQYRIDALNHGRISPALYHAITKAGKVLLSNAAKLTMPLLLMHGDADRITSFAATEALSRRCPTAEFVPWPDQLHELHNDTLRNSVFERIEQWLNAHVPQQTPEA